MKKIKLNIKMNLRLVLLCCVGLVICLSAKAQGPQHESAIKAHFDGQKIKLRWAFSSVDAWNIAKDKGVVIERITIEENGVALSAADQFASQVSIVDGLVPLSENGWDLLPQSNEVQIAKTALYSTEFDAPLSATPNLADAANYKKQEETKVVFSLLAAELDYNAAQGLALGLTDDTAEEQKEYMYKLRVAGPTAEHNVAGSFTRLSTMAVTTYEAPQLEYIEGENKLANLYFTQDTEVNAFSSYDIERSTNGTHFQKVNELPFYFVANDEQFDEVMTYVDSLPDNDNVYYYRVVGRSSFNTLSEPSEVLEVQGVPERMKMNLKISNHEINEQLDIYWIDLEESYDDSLQGFNVYRSVKNAGPYEKVNGDLIAAHERSYRDMDPLKTGYYKIEAVDLYGHEYESYEVLVQAEDEEPPAVPDGLEGHFTSSNALELHWVSNTESDLEGYRVFVANAKNDQFVEATKYPLKESSYVYYFDGSFSMDSLYVSLVSLDKRENHSQKSTPIGFARPDAIPPADPNLFKVMPTPEGIEIGWSFSSSDDVAWHKLQRRYSSGGSWDDVLTINPEDEDQYEEEGTTMGATNWIDTTELEQRTYDYRMVAMDESYNISSSKLKYVTPYSDMAEGDVTDFELELEELNFAPNTDYEVLLSNLEKEGYETSQLRSTPSSDYALQLKWKYPMNSTVQDFQILRAVTGNTMQVYKTLTPAQALGYVNAEVEITGAVGTIDLFYTDNALEKGKRYVYQILVRHVDGSTSKRSVSLNKKVPVN